MSLLNWIWSRNFRFKLWVNHWIGKRFLFPILFIWRLINFFFIFTNVITCTHCRIILFLLFLTLYHLKHNIWIFILNPFYWFRVISIPKWTFPIGNWRKELIILSFKLILYLFLVFIFQNFSLACIINIF